MPTKGISVGGAAARSALARSKSHLSSTRCLSNPSWKPSGRRKLAGPALPVLVRSLGSLSYAPDAYDFLSVEEMAMQGRRAATAAKIMLTMLETPLDWSFYFLLWDNCMFNEEFSTFYTPKWAQAVMY